MLVISLPCLCVCHAWWTMGCSNDVVCGGLLVRWNQPTEPRSAQCEDRKWVHCSEGCLLPHCFSRPRPVWDGLYSGTHSSHYAPAVPFTQLWAICARASRIHSERSHTESGPFISGNVLGSPTSSSHLAKNRKQIEACLDVHPSGLFRGGAFG